MAARLELLKQQFADANGNPYASGTLEFYVVGTSTPKYVYTDATGDTQLGTTITLNERGESATDIYGDGYYKIVLKDSSGTTIDTYSSVAGVGESSFITIGDYSNNLESALTALSGTNATLYIDAACDALTASRTIPTNLAVVVLKGGSINLGGSTYDLTINGPFRAGPHNVFTSLGSGTITISNVDGFHYPDWYGTTTEKVTLDAMKTALGSSSRYLITMSQQTWTINDNLTLTSNFSFDIPDGAVFSISDTKTLTFDGPVNAGPYRIFSYGGSSSAVDLNRNPIIHAEWFGAIDGTADEAQINLAITAATSNGGIVQLLDRQYEIDASVVMKSNVHLKGAAEGYQTGGTRFNVDSGITAISVGGSVVSNFKISDILITGDGDASQVGMYFYNSGGNRPLNGIVENVSILDVGEDGVRIDSAANIEFNKVVVYNAGDAGYIIQDVTSGTASSRISFINCVAEECNDQGFHIDFGNDIYLERCQMLTTDDGSSAGSGLKISGSAKNIYVNNCLFKDNELIGIEIHADDQDLSSLFFRDNRIIMLGSSTSELAVKVHRDSSWDVKDLLIDGLVIDETNSFTPTDTISFESTLIDLHNVRLLNIRDNASNDPENISGIGYLSEYTSSLVYTGKALDDEASPSVAGGKFFIVTGTTTITDLTGGHIGQLITLYFAASVTVNDTATVNLAGGANQAFALGDTLQLICGTVTGIWYEVSRTDTTA